jgi:hypothetical protein
MHLAAPEAIQSLQGNLNTMYTIYSPVTQEYFTSFNGFGRNARSIVPLKDAQTFHTISEALFALQHHVVMSGVIWCTRAEIHLMGRSELMYLGTVT